MQPTLRLQRTTSITEVPAAAWDALDHQGVPFLRWGMLAALELSHSIDAGPLRLPTTGWLARYLLLWDGATLVGGVACYLKTHSFGEYVFDYQWARVAEQHGLPYYPKLVVGVPATPVTGPRLLCGTALDAPQRAHVQVTLLHAVRELGDELGVYSIHWLFCTAAEQALLVAHGYAARDHFQYHWQNRGYADFDGFLASFKSRKRKQLRKERLAVAYLQWQWLDGAAAAPDLANRFYAYYQRTVDNHQGRAYLTPAFFAELGARLAPCVTLLLGHATGQAEPVAAALFLEGPTTLYGRYWGPAADLDEPYVHFEAAYYQGLDRAIARGLTVFEAGAQGEHKLLRGFLPTATYSAHWIRHEPLHQAITRACLAESRQVAEQMRELATFAPYHEG